MSLLKLTSLLAVVRLILVEVDVVKRVVESEPLEEIKTCMSDSPIDDHFHLPYEWQGSVNPEQINCHEGSVPHECCLVRSLRVAMFQLEGSVHEVTDPEQVVNEQGWIAAKLNSLLNRHDETSINMNIAHKGHIQSQLDSQRVLGPFVLTSILNLRRSPLESVLSCSIQHALDHHQDHE